MRIIGVFVFLIIGLINFTQAQKIISAEYFFDTDPGRGNGMPISIGSASDSLDLNLNIPTAGLQEGSHQLFICVQDSLHNWSITRGKSFVILDTTNAQSTLITRAEYFFDTDPGRGNGTPISIGSAADSLDLNLNIPTAGLQEGSHQLFICFQDSLHNWSITRGKSFVILDTTNAQSTQIISGEYFFDADPGVGNGYALPAFSASDSLDLNKNIDVSFLSEGGHQLFFRFSDTQGNKTIVSGKPFQIKSNQGASSSLIKEGEYFFDNDPGIGNATPIDISTPTDSVNLNFYIGTDSLSAGTHYLFMRFKDSLGNWSIYQSDTIIKTICYFPTANFSVSDACEGDSISYINLSTTVDTNTSYHWDVYNDGIMVDSSTGSWKYSGMNSGVYTTKLIVSNGQGCADSITKSFTVFALPAPNLGNDTAICAGNSLTLSPGSFSSYQWNNNATNPTINISSAATFWVDVANGNGCTKRDSILISVNSLPNVSMTGIANSYCINSGAVSVITSPQGGVLSGLGISGNTFSPAASGVGSRQIIYQYTDNNSCTNYDTAITTIYALPTVNITSAINSNYCATGDSVLLSASPNGGSFSGLNIQSSGYFLLDTSNLGARTIIYDFTDSHSCSSSDTVITTIYALPTVNITSTINSSYCATGDSVLLSASPNGGSFSGLNIQSSGYFLLDTSNLGAKSIIYDFTDSHSCSSSDTALTWIHALPSVDFSGLASSYCLNDPVDILIPNIPGGVFLGSGISGNSFNSNQAGTGQHNIKYVYTDSYGCFDSITKSTFIFQAPPISTFSATPTSFTAPPFVVNFNSNIPNASNYNIKWYFGDGTTSYDSIPTHLYSYNGSYTVSLSAYDLTTGCADTLTKSSYISCSGANPCGINAQIYPNTINQKTICPGDSFLLNAGTYNSSYSYQWIRNGIIIQGATNTDYYAKQFGYYQIMIGDGSCNSFSNLFFLNVFNTVNPVIHQYGNLQPCTDDSTALFTPTTYSNYLWSTGDAASIIYVKTSGYYTLSTIDLNGCKSTSLPLVINGSYLNVPRICLVEVDSITGKNIIIWNNNFPQTTDSFRVYREGVIANQYDFVASLPSSANTFVIDTGSYPKKHFYRYRLSAIDSCGFSTPLSSFHRTIHLYVTAGMNNSWNLFWNRYKGKNCISYQIYRGPDTTQMQLIAQVPANIFSFTDLNAPAGNIHYVVKAVFLEACSSVTGNFKKTSASNYINSKDATGVGITYLKDRKYSAIIYPNPNHGVFHIEYKSNVKAGVQVEIYNNLGVQLYKNQQSSQSNSSIKIEIPGLAKGVYFIRLIQSDRIFEAKMIVL